jgi:hypothetical protein
MTDENDSAQKVDGRRQPPEEPMLYCPVCNTRLSEMKCKLVCAKCGYYMSCADYY